MNLIKRDKDFSEMSSRFGNEMELFWKSVGNIDFCNASRIIHT